MACANSSTRSSREVIGQKALSLSRNSTRTGSMFGRSRLMVSATCSREARKTRRASWGNENAASSTRASSGSMKRITGRLFMICLICRSRAPWMSNMGGTFPVRENINNRGVKVADWRNLGKGRRTVAAFFAGC